MKMLKVVPKQSFVSRATHCNFVADRCKGIGLENGMHNIFRIQLKYSTERHLSTESPSSIWCPSCGASTRRQLQFFCPSCSAVLAPNYPAKFSYFDLLEIPEVFNIDTKLLDTKHKELQRRLHPDATAFLEQETKNFCTAHLDVVMKALAILKDPVQRSRHLQSLLCPDDKINKSSEGDSGVQPEVLMHVLELHEELDACKNAAAAEHLQKKLLKETKRLCGELGGAFEKKDWNLTERLTSELQMYEKVLNRLNDTYFPSDTSMLQ